MAFRKSGFLVVGAAALSTSIVVSCGKDEAGNSTASNAPDPNEPYTAVEGAEATQFLASGFAVKPADSDALSKSLALAEAAEAGAEGAALLEGETPYFQADTATLNFLKAAEGQKLKIDTAAFKLPTTDSLAAQPAAREEPVGANLIAADPPLATDPATFDPKKDTVKLDAASWANKTEIKVSRLTNIPVKDQGVRGTCAAHTGAGALEYLLLKKYSSRFSTVDLSEQRFYMMSKSNLWKTGGVVDKDAGSSWAKGFEMSLGTAGVTAPSKDPKFNIPLEKDCPYVKTAGKNELQIAQAATCTRGSVKVSSMSDSWYYIKAGNKKEWHSNALLKAQQILDYLIKTDLPVPIATELTSAWMKNDGMITYAKSKGQAKQGGHAYLIVGARKLNEKAYPGEGGMCFIIKNSWGIGWGAGGYSCMTLTWFNNFRRAEFYELAFDANVDIDYVAPLPAKTVPVTVPKAKLTDLENGDEGVPELVKVAVPDNPGTEAAADTAAPAAPEPAGTTADGYTVGGLVDPTGNIVKAFYKIDGGNIDIVGILKGETGVTQSLTLAFEAATGNLTYTDPSRGPKVVGDLKDGTITLCSQQYADTCALNFVEAGKRLVLGLTEAAFRNYAADANAKYTSLISYAGYAVEFALAGDSFADFRLQIGGVPTNPIRLHVDAASGAIAYKGKDIGNYQKLAFCSGDYKNVCRLVVNSEDKTLNILFKMR